ncbi:efflux RND transporter periplasmic adaptor subunit [uncultured Cohaesibacter sp.]|uniref:efflux RND transporter periplasmic adaptor subunit n=1 Tax=uncultured Cohaesibacter sp. TaxID=1002546 RepID=UPI0029C82EDA|nr:efflux RND transporter periplasmic adaptor subunit [uncultured Cohaesibacter sp.]
MALRLKGSYGLALLCTAGIVGWMATGEAVFSGQETAEATPPPAVRTENQENALFRVAVQHFSAKPRLSTLTIRGRTEADTKVTVRAETSAIVQSIAVEKGQWVHKGDLLCKLDIGSREASLAKARAALEQAEFDLQAKETLATKGFASKTQLAALRASRDAAIAGVKEAALELDRTNILAPVDGLVQGDVAEIGDQLSIGGACAELVNPDPMLVVGQVSERDIAQVEVGNKAQVNLVTGEKTEGRVRFVSSVSDVETRTFLVEVEIPNPDRSLRDGVTAVANLALPPIKAHLMSPALLTLSDEGIVGAMQVVDDTARFTPVNIVSNDENGVWLTGLPDEVDLITVGQEYVKSGQKVVPVPADAMPQNSAENKSASKADGKTGGGEPN